MGLLASLVTFFVSLLVGGLAIFVAASIVAGTRNYEYAVFTALVGAIVWGVTDAFLGWVPLVGDVLPLVAWVWAVKWRYRGSWLEAGIIGLLAWVAAVLLLSVLGFLGVGAVGVPFA